ncbi:hypothetical protein B0H16DRAFT_1465053 [Mycena metata]|uniref:Uncharacterized protein n=1 Tax=Mycena metata TaxID=1033252 RepID=A0AAD7N163_9AGAR|nr:hypothetical protein B0H16DRAFT_1465053 [Mycena metata]
MASGSPPTSPTHLPQYAPLQGGNALDASGVATAGASVDAGKHLVWEQDLVAKPRGDLVDPASGINQDAIRAWMEALVAVLNVPAARTDHLPRESLHSGRNAGDGLDAAGAKVGPERGRGLCRSRAARVHHNRCAVPKTSRRVEDEEERDVEGNINTAEDVVRVCDDQGAASLAPPTPGSAAARAKFSRLTSKKRDRINSISKDPPTSLASPTLKADSVELKTIWANWSEVNAQAMGPPWSNWLSGWLIIQG